MNQKKKNDDDEEELMFRNSNINWKLRTLGVTQYGYFTYSIRHRVFIW